MKSLRNISRNVFIKEHTQMNKWLDLVGSEEMESEKQESLIHHAIMDIKKVIGEPKNTLCVGCADGTEMKYFDKPFGIDLNEKSLAKCREKNLQVEKMDMHHMTFSDNTFELVYSKDNFEHAISHIEALSEYARVSSRYVAIVLPDDSWQSSGWHFIIPTLKQMVTLGEKCGLMFKALREYNLIVGRSAVYQSIYIFQK